ncbi:ras association domain-containing protein 8-like isoform X2 [Nelusetta ayraudi]|uniref:ras association domain-containing protein 8-like isoform X2 n=1 Tax=Nelusetta ayraudi TaxID=303726 RepID=UPI003F6F6E85
MELKVWVEGVARVVCGVSLATSCQDVVVALARATGRTGRYLLVLKLRGAERHLVADDHPVQLLAWLGQSATDVRFVLQRVGPSLAGGPAGQELLHRPGSAEPLLLEPVGPHGSSTLPRRTEPRATPEPRASPVSALDTCQSARRSSSSSSSLSSLSSSSSSSSYKDELFRRTLQQQRRLQDLEVQLQSLEQEVWERERSSPGAPGLVPGQMEELELELTAQWQRQLQAEVDRERDMQRHLQQLRSSMQRRSAQVDELQARSAHLETDLHHLVRTQQDELWRPLKQELQHRLQQAEELEASLAHSQGALQAAELKLQKRRQTVEELNKELRQIQLQHFILQSGAGELQLSNAGILEQPGGSLTWRDDRVT